jgi:hypothetical protein
VADLDGSFYPYPPVYSGEFGAVVDGTYYLLGSEGVTPGLVAKFKMRAQDRDAVPGYVTWISTGTPDFAGVGYSGGTPTPTGPMVPGSAVIEDEWEE